MFCCCCCCFSLKSHFFYLVNKISPNKMTTKDKTKNNNKTLQTALWCFFPVLEEFCCCYTTIQKCFHLRPSSHWRNFSFFHTKLSFEWFTLSSCLSLLFFQSFMNKLGLVPRKILLWQEGGTKAGFGHLKRVTKIHVTVITFPES